jgi:hypothetical protein
VDVDVEPDADRAAALSRNGLPIVLRSFIGALG